MICIKNSFLSLFFIPFLIFAQKPEKNSKDIDFLLTEAKKCYKKFEDTKCLEYAKQASNLAKKATDTKREAEGYFLMARVLATLHIQKESMFYMEKAERLGYAKGSKILQAELNEIKSFNYRSLGLNFQSLKVDKSIISLLESTNSLSSLKIKARAYGNIGSYYYALGKTDSSFLYLKKKEEILKKIPENQVVLEIADFLDGKGYVFLERNELDSAYHYFKKGYAFKLKHKDPLLYIQYCAFAEYHIARGEKNEALRYYLKTIENIQEYDVKHTDYLIVYKTISELYGEMKQIDKEALYLNRYTQINDSVNKLKEANIDYITNIILNEKEQEFHSDKKTTVALLLTISIIGIIISYLIYRKYRKTKESETKSKKLVLEKEYETIGLKLKLNESFQELIVLAKTNHTSFYARFQETYPEFQKQLLSINPNLQIPELTLSAYIYLDFQTKEIADYTFKSFRTIQNRKNRLRKKLNLSSTENLNVWFKNLISTHELPSKPSL